MYSMFIQHSRKYYVLCWVLYLQDYVYSLVIQILYQGRWLPLSKLWETEERLEGLERVEGEGVAIGVEG
jgi:hypothetical protein